MELDFEVVAERAPVRVRIDSHKTDDGERWWTACDDDASLDAIVGVTAEQAVERVLERLEAPLGGKA